MGLIKENPVKNVRKPKPAPARARRLTPREEKQILRYCHAYKNKELMIIIILALETAMRQGEILGLQWQHVDLFKRTVHLPDTKNGTSRDVPLSLKAKEVLLELDGDLNGNVFKLTSRGLKSAWRKIMLSLKIEDLKFHDLRHEAVSRLFELSTLDMMEVASISGHKSLAMLKRYTHLKTQRLVKKLDGNRSKSTQTVLNHLVPYPAFLMIEKDEFKICIPDFENTYILASSREEVQEKSQSLLLKSIVKKLRDGKKVPKPDSYLITSNELTNGELVFVDPMG